MENRYLPAQDFGRPSLAICSLFGCGCANDLKRPRASRFLTISVVALAVGNWFACPGLLADEVELPMSVTTSLDSLATYESSELVHSEVEAPSESPVNHPNANPATASSNYRVQAVRPDRWDSSYPQFPWLAVPGTCDDWRVGPVFSVRTDGLLLYRTDVSSDFLTSSLELGAAPPFVLQHVNTFEHAGGARAYVTSQNYGNFAMQAGYVGAADWHASAESQFTDGVDPLLDVTRLNSYDSSLHAVELNFLPHPVLQTQLLMGIRYVDFGEDYLQLTDRVNFDINNNNLATGLNDEVSALRINNRLIGSQLGLRRDMWSTQRRFSFESLVNGGLFCNMVSRKEVDQTFVTVNLPDDPGTVEDESQQTEVRVDETTRRRRANEPAFFGEAALTGVYRFHPCLSVRTGYQAIWLAGVNLATDSFGDASSVFFHGIHFGVEYRR